MTIINYLLMNFLNGMMGIFWLLIGFWLFNRFTPNWDFEKVFKEKGISGGAIVVAAYIIGLAFIIAWAVF